MLPSYKLINQNSWTRRQLLVRGVTVLGASALGTAIALQNNRSLAAVKIPPIKETTSTSNLGFNPMSVLRDFDYGKVKRENGRTIREFEVTANSSPIQLNSAISFVSWSLNNRVPGPTFRAKEGEIIRVIFHNEDGSSHSIHFHGVHRSEMDGIEPIRRGETTVYEFEAKPYGVHPYHCHVAPITRHISKGLYGLLIVDPPQGRPPADEMVLVMSGYDLDDNEQNELYAFNGIPNFYRDNPIAIYQNQLIRIYLLNMIEFDPAITFHIHANMFQVYRTGRTLKPCEESDVITLGTAERHIIEFTYTYPGRYMFHPHQDYIAENGCMGWFEVISS
ncbi:multicopper oxidase type 2 [Stanieria cyanosphaera PCC 7437]|uniref:Multicopper oxidase type 2 n=1 Tax=Stanieria cyanosphaera (strain ATCC 29371 / PCC 7437) TaxID=111780 RepID=K9XPG4_STAC7|nr:multicopper oxidase domain-containing protein [Stanieria cyanosphaera]AFZ33984.1 multicopper oxidase type 2 [Stanieria cyanosphaera PCC 7437]